MIRFFSLSIAHVCTLALLVFPLGALYLLVDIGAFARLSQAELPIPIIWQSVGSAQWYGFWVLTALYLAPGLIGLFYLRRAFANFANGEFFNSANSRDLKQFSVFLFIQALAKPLHFSIATLLLSMNHPPGQKMLSVSLGTNELKVIVLAMILWVISELLLKGAELERENKQFI